MNILDLTLHILQDALWSGIAAVGFAILFNVPKRTLVACAVCGAAGHALRALLINFDMQIVPATLVGATLVGFLSIWFAQRAQVPAAIFAICGAIPMVPGTFAYRAMIGFIRLTWADSTATETLLVDAGVNFITTGLILAAIAAGIAAPTLLFRRRKPIV